MKKKVIVTLVFLMVGAVAFHSCNYWKNVMLLTRGSVKEQSFLKAVDFELRKGLVVVKARVNQSKEELEFIFDTGAFDNKISAKAANDLNLITASTKEKSDSHGNVKNINMTVIEFLEIGGVTFQNTAAGIIDYPENSASECIARDGIIGANLIRECNWKIDYVNKKIWMTDDFSRFEEIKDKSIIKFEHPLLSGTPKIEMNYNGQILGNILFDVGSNGGIDLPKSVLGKLNGEINNRRFTTTIDNTSSGIWGRRLDSVLTTTATIEIGVFNFENQDVHFKSHGFAKIGNKVLSKFDLYLNYQDDEIVLIPNKNFSIREDNKEFGFIPLYINNDYWVVKNLQLGGVGDLAGIDLNDTITSINGKSPKDYFTNYCEFFFWVGDFLDDKDSLFVEMTHKKVVLVKSN